MKKTEQKEIGQSTIEQLRAIRDKINIDIKDMTFEQLKRYVDDRLTLHPKAIWKKEQ